jgi:uracil-DNA glycosylase
MSRLAPNLQAPDVVPAAPLLRGSVEGANCAGCPFSKDGQPNHPVRGEGPADPAWIVVGEGPGHNEMREGRPWVGQSGQLVNKMFQQIRRPRAEVWVTNATLCIPKQGMQNDDKAKAAAAVACKPRLQNELARFPSKPILAMGAVAAKSLITTSLFKISQISGTTHDADVDGTGSRTIIPTIHPAAILRGGAGTKGAHAADVGFWNLIYDGGKVEAISRGRNIDIGWNLEIEFGTEDRPADTRYVDDLMVKIYKSAVKTKLVCIDVETYVEDEKRHTALMAIVAKIHTIGVGTPELSISVPWDAMSHRGRNAFRAILENRTIEKTYHNKTYDAAVLMKYGYAIQGRQHCTLLGHHAAFPGMVHNLQSVTTQFYAAGPWKAEFRDGKEEDPEEGAVYNAKDAFAGAKNVAPLLMFHKRTGTERIYEIDCEMAQVAAEMHLAGVPIDRDVNQQIARQMSVVIDRVEEEIYAQVEALGSKFYDRLAFERAKRSRVKNKKEALPDGKRMDFTQRLAVRVAELAKECTVKKWHPPLRENPFRFSLDNSEHIVAFLRAQGVALMELTATGRTSTAKEVLEKIGDIPEVAAIMEYRSYDDVLADFITCRYDHINVKGEFVPGDVFPDGRTHPIWSPNKITGRWSSSRNHQNWTEGDSKKGIPNVRAQVVAPDDWFIVGFDMAQGEPRVMALYSGDPYLCKIFAEGRDIHGEFAREWNKDFIHLERESGPWTIIRNVTKTLEYAAIYGGSDETAYKTLLKKGFGHIKFADCSLATTTLKSKIPVLRKWQEDQIRLVAQPPHELKSILGRRRCFPLGNAPPTDVVNYRVQAGLADVVDEGLIDLRQRMRNDRRYWGADGKPLAYPIIHVHDAIYFLCREHLVPKLREDITAAWTRDYTYNGVTVPFVPETKVCKDLTMRKKKVAA